MNVFRFWFFVLCVWFNLTVMTILLWMLPYRRHLDSPILIKWNIVHKYIGFSSWYAWRWFIIHLTQCENETFLTWSGRNLTFQCNTYMIRITNINKKCSKKMKIGAKQFTVNYYCYFHISMSLLTWLCKNNCNLNIDSRLMIYFNDISNKKFLKSQRLFNAKMYISLEFSMKSIQKWK